LTSTQVGSSFYPKYYAREELGDNDNVTKSFFSTEQHAFDTNAEKQLP